MKLGSFSLGTGLAMVGIVASLVPSGSAVASTNGRRNTAIGLGAAAAYELLNKKTTNGLLLGAGAAYAYKKYQDEARAEKRGSRVAQYRTRSYNSSSRYYGSRYGGSTYSPATYNGSQYRSGYRVFDARITHDTDLIHRRVLAVRNGVGLRITVPKDAAVYQAGSRVSVHDLMQGDVIRVTAIPVGRNEWRARRIDVISSNVASTRSRDPYDPAYDNTVDNGGGYVDRGYDSGSVDTYNAEPAHYSGTGTVESINLTNHSFVVRAGGHVRRVFVRDTTLSGFNSLRDLQVGDRVRVNGDMTGSAVDATGVTLLD